MISWWVPYLAKGPRPDFNNCPWDNLNSGRILAPSVYSNLTKIMAPLQVIPVLVRWKMYLSRSLIWAPGGCSIWPRAPRPDFNNSPGDNSNSGRTLAPDVYSSPIQKWPFPWPFQSWNAEEDYHSLYYHRPFDFTIFPSKCYEASFKRAQSV